MGLYGRVWYISVYVIVFIWAGVSQCVWVAVREKPSGVSPGLSTLFETSLHSYLSQSRLTGP